MTKKQVSADELIAVIIKGIDDVKGENIQLLDLRELENTVCDYFIICSGSSNTQVNAISGSVQKVVKGFFTIIAIIALNSPLKFSCASHELASMAVISATN